MLVTVITPLYKGQKYIDQYLKCIEANRRSLDSGDRLQVILVEDCPAEPTIVEMPAGEAPPDGVEAEPYITYIPTEENLGIHGARIKGLSQAKRYGNYILFLDQDDLLADDAIAKMIEEMKKAPVDVLVSNAVLVQKDGSRPLWYRTDYHKKRVGDLSTYLSVGCQIMSPGQCLIRREVIPDLWLMRPLENNGADDYFLWIMLLTSGAAFRYLDEGLYIHSYTGENVSGDTGLTAKSTYEFAMHLEDFPPAKPRYIGKLVKQTFYKDEFRRASKIRKVMLAVRFWPITISNLIYKKRTKTPYGFNRA